MNYNLKNLFLLSGLLLAATASADYPAGYYNALDGKTGAELKKAAKSVAAKHTVISYGNNTWDAFEKTDTYMHNGKLAWYDMYSNDVVYVSQGHPGLNIEHSVANSWWGKTKNDAYKDLFHLNPSAEYPNNKKANYPLGEINGTPTWTNGPTSIGKPVSGQGGGSSMVYEPEDRYKGDFARAFMYIFTVYDNISWKDNTAWMYDTSSDLTFKPWARQLLLKWNDADPVDEKESNRQEAIYKIQKNRNPYIDLPALCHYIWGEMSGQPFHPENGGDIPTPPVTPPEDGTTVLLDMPFDSEADINALKSKGWSNVVESGTLAGWYITEYDGNKYAAASAYKGTLSGGPYEYWLITPALNTLGYEDVTLTFRTQGAYGVDNTSLEVYTMTTPDPKTAQLNKLSAKVCTPNAVGTKPVYCDWVASGATAIDERAEKVYIGFRYLSEEGGSDHSATYCVDDVKVIAKGTAAVEDVEVDDVMIVAGYQGAIHVLSPAELKNLRVVDLGGRIVASRTAVGGEEVIELPAGMYIVVADGIKPLKVLVR